MVIFHHRDRPDATEEDGKQSAIFFREQTDPYCNMMMTDERMVGFRRWRHGGKNVKRSTNIIDCGILAPIGEARGDRGDYRGKHSG